MLDEVAPREIGREAQLLKKRALNAYHKRERSPDVELSEADLMGGDDFQARYGCALKKKVLFYAYMILDWQQKDGVMK